ncbi:ImmA/IrrE family metallo-endopeptidase [Lacticaseibacillus paracasei]|uniref:ImmA/IrrE family metallo-endopeptidase n=1 Tax=Lacticaseibacillus paracasei TaxID=1597 RepID=UPI0031F505AD
MKYSEIYSTDFINKVNEIKSEAATGIIADQEITKNFIDIEDMLKQLGFSIIKDDHLPVSGRIDGETILIDSSENQARQRFSMAHELGHAVLHQRAANRTDHNDGYSLEERSSEVFANTFASQLLMPRNLVKKLLGEIIQRHGYNPKRITNIEFSAHFRIKLATVSKFFGQ